MTDEPKFDIYPKLDADIREATQANDGDSSDNIGAGGLAKAVKEAVGDHSESTAYSPIQAQQKIKTLFKDFPDVESYHERSGDRNFRTHRADAKRLADKNEIVATHQKALSDSSLIDKLLGNDRIYEERLEEAQAAAGVIQNQYDATIEESKADVEIYHEQGLLLTAMTDVYNQIVSDLGRRYAVRGALLKPDEFSSLLNRAYVSQRDDRIGAISSVNRYELGSTIPDPKKQAIVMALREIFTPRIRISEISEDEKHSEAEMCFPRKNLGTEKARAESQASEVNSDYILRVRQAVDAKPASIHEMPAEYFIPVDNYTAALIKYLDNHARKPDNSKINDAAVLDCSPSITSDSKIFAAFDLIDPDEPEVKLAEAA